MKYELLQPYLQQFQQLKEHYKHQININIGLEIDYIIGFEEETRYF